jgi:hypothetical protein
LAPIPASLTKDANSIGRSPQLLIIVMIFIALFFVFLQKNLSVTSLKIALALTISFSLYYGLFFNYYYQKIYPEETKFEFQYGEVQVYSYLLKNQDDFERVDIDGDINQPYIYYLFYSKLDPRNIDQATLKTKIGKFNFMPLKSIDIGKGTLLLRVEDSKAVYLEVYKQPNKIWRVILVNRIKNNYYNSSGGLQAKPN